MNSKEWERRSDEWVKSLHASRLRKEKAMAASGVVAGTKNYTRVGFEVSGNISLNSSKNILQRSIKDE